MKVVSALFGKILMAVMAASVFACNTPSETVGGTADKKEFAIMAYYTGRPAAIDAQSAGQLTHIIYSFFHLDGNTLNKATPKDSTSLTYLVSLKQAHPDLKIMFSLGGWGGCETCSDVFATAQGREEFAKSVKALSGKYNLDGIDLDWEYPTIAGFPGHRFAPEDKQNFTALVQQLRKTLGDDYIITFAAGGFNDYLEQSVEWDKIMPLLDYVNLMSYDLVNGNSTVTGNHTPLYSTPSQVESIDNAVQYLDSIGVPSRKIVVGSAFYARVWEDVPDQLNGIYQSGRFKEAVNYNDLDNYFTANPGFTAYWDSTAQAPFSYNASKQLFATYDDSLSIARKTEYALAHNLGGIMFWEFSGDKMDDGLLDVMYHVKMKEAAARNEQ
ncbi:glycoside hydrolase family 18 protein [Pontibacter sp. 172403-2]|uniref:glycoside hydrolase family 18 protein n=1 Tax=Pontibacter rufus TaxID=2791028 RepID=UPI0018AF5665|nr:glycoside hydrolase family 18 protein [Pontibacter sp. 172403-2]MBF9253444.1 glycoside hydrolase family 18 protein [Pontibacter sp. 172403-2]